jgi:hypothetical protein
MRMNHAGLARSVILVAAAAVGLFQLVWVGQTSLTLGVNKVWVDRHLDAVSRSADVAYGSAFNAYISFLRQQIPEGATVVDTRTFGLVQYDSPAFIQYFLFPRTILPLSNSACHGVGDLNQCILALSGPQTYFIVGANFKLSPVISERFYVRMFQQSLGLLAPLSAGGQP